MPRSTAYSFRGVRILAGRGAILGDIERVAQASALLVNGLEWSRAHKPDGLRVHMCLEGGFRGWL